MIPFSIQPGQPVVLFLHAFPLNKEMWQSQIHTLSEAGYSSIAVDYPGFGEAQGPVSSYTLADLAGEIRKIMDHLEIRQVIPVGCSMGGYLALEFCHHYPEMIAGLVLANTRSTADTEEGKKRRYTLAEEIQKTGDTLPIRQLHQDKFFSPETRMNHPEIPEKVWRMMESASPEGLVEAQYAMAARQDRTDVLRNLSIPILFIHGKHDGFIPESELQWMVQNSTSPRVEIFDHCAHLCNLEDQVRFNRVLLEYLTQLKK